MSVSLSWLCAGNIVAYPTRALPELQSNETNIEIQLDEQMGSWFASSFWWCGIFMCSFGGYLGGILGRRKLILLTVPILIYGWAEIGTAENRISLFKGRILSTCALTCQVGAPGRSM